MVRWLIGGAILVVAGVLFMPLIGFYHSKSAEGQEKPGTLFAIDRVQPEVAEVAFDGKRAIAYLEKICAIGPRMSGTPGMTKQQELMRDHFDKLGVKLQSQNFMAKQRSQERQVAMTNLIASFHPDIKRRVILCSHYDTRPIADQEPDPRKWRLPFVSANDGGSGVAFLMEMAHHIKDIKLKVGVDFVFFDGEEYIFDHDRDKYFFGSEFFAKEWTKTKREPAYVGAVLLDMIAGKHAKFPVEGHSLLVSRDLCMEIWRIAEEVKAPAFKYQQGQRVMDDHLALQRVGIPAVDLIDFDYPSWHKLSDTPAQCSPEPLVQVAKVLSTWMQRQK